MTPEQVEPMPGAIMVWRDEQDKVCIEQLSPLFAMVIEQLTQNVKLTDQDIHTLIQSVLTDLSEHDIFLQIQELKALLTRMRLIQASHNVKGRGMTSAVASDHEEIEDQLHNPAFLQDLRQQMIKFAFYSFLLSPS